MKVIIAGSRSLAYPDPLIQAVHESGWGDQIEMVITGGCPTGADYYAERWATLHGVPLKVVPADWKQYGKMAGPLRNANMAMMGDALIAVWDGHSRGTASMIREAEALGLKVYVHRF